MGLNEQREKAAPHLNVLAPLNHPAHEYVQFYHPGLDHLQLLIVALRLKKSFVLGAKHAVTDASQDVAPFQRHPEVFGVVLPAASGAPLPTEAI